MTIEFGNYQLIEKIGKGGMAEVFLARRLGAEGLEKQLVIKKILPEFSENRHFVDMFIAEAKIAMGLNHPNIVQIYDFGKVENDYYLAMEYVDGVNISQLLSACQRSGQTLSVGNAIYIAVELAKGLDYAHRRLDRYGNSLGLVHRDISPHNILISYDGTVKLVDFGIAKATSIADDAPNEVKGKFSYMSPEQASGSQVDQRSDLFSLGIVLFEMVCGRQLFRQTTQEETLSLVRSAVVPDIHELNGDIPAALEHLLYKTLARLPQDRYATVRDFQLDLTRVLYSLGEMYDGVTAAEHLRRVEAFLHRVETQDLGEYSFSEDEEVATAVMRGETSSKGSAVSTDSALVWLANTNDPMISRRRKDVVLLSGRTYGLVQLRRTLSRERWQFVYQAYKRLVDSIAYKNDAVVHRLGADGFMLLLGLPVSSENDSQHAAYIALDIHEAVTGMSASLDTPLQVGIGIAIGEVLLEQDLGRVGRRYDWTLFGTGHEVAEGLSRAAFSQEILIGNFLYHRVRREFHCIAVDDVRVSGVDGTLRMVQSFRLDSPKSSQNKLDELRDSYQAVYGREILRKTLRAKYRETLLDKKAASVVILGATGVGKSILVDEFLAGLDPRDVRIVRGVVTALERHIPLGSAVGLIGGILRLGDRRDQRGLRARLESRVRMLFADDEGGEVLEVQEALESLFGLATFGSSIDLLRGEELRAKIFWAIHQVIARAAEKEPLVMAFDDAHCIDPLSLRAAKEFLEKYRDVPAFFVLTLRDDQTIVESQDWAGFMKLKAVHREYLAELTEHEAEPLVRELLASYGVFHDRLVHEVLRCSGGNPLYIKEVIEALHAGGWLVEGKVASAVKAIAQGASWLPVSVEGWIGARIDRLTLVEKMALQRVAFLWPSFTLSDAQLAMNESKFRGGLRESGGIGHVLDKLVTGGLLIRSTTVVPAVARDVDAVVEVRYRFCNLLTQEVAVRGLVPEEATDLSRRLAEVLLSRRGMLGLGESVRIARYYEIAGDRALAIQYFRESAKEALELVGAEECVRLCEELLDRFPHRDGERVRTKMLLQTALVEAGMQQRSLDVLETLETLVFEAGSITDQVDVLVRLSSYYHEHSSLQRAHAYLNKAQRICNQCTDFLSRARMWKMSAVLAIADGKSKRALMLLDRIIGVYSQLPTGDDDVASLAEVGAAYNIRGVIFRQTGRYVEALEAYEKALEYALVCKNGRQVHMLSLNSAIALVFLHRLREALVRYEAALETSRRLGHERGVAELLVNMGDLYYLQGDYSRALSCFDDGVSLGRALHYTRNIADGQISLGLCLLEMSSLEQAESALQEGLELADSVSNPYLGLHAMLGLARVGLARETLMGAQIAWVHGEDALKRASAAKMIWGEAVALSLMGRALHVLGRGAEAVEHSRRAVSLVDVCEVFDKEEILYFHYRILVEQPDLVDEGMGALEQAYQSLMQTADGIVDERDRAAFLGRPAHLLVASSFRCWRS